MAVLAKLYVSSAKRQASSPDSVEVTLAAVTRGEENRSWAEATPAASFSMTINNPEAAAEFVLGQEFFVRFDKADPVVSLADGHPYEPSDYEKQKNDDQPYYRCTLCNAKRISHDEPLRSQLVKLAGL
jgi:hypothetical protein